MINNNGSPFRVVPSTVDARQNDNGESLESFKALADTLSGTAIPEQLWMTGGVVFPFFWIKPFGSGESRETTKYNLIYPCNRRACAR
jgi:hypothetical protein